MNKIDDNYSYIIGLWLGDGGRAGKGGFMLTQGIKKNINKIKEILEIYFHTPVHIKKDGPNCVNISALKTQEFTNNLRNKVITGEIWNEIKTNPYPCLAGFIDTDGSVLKGYEVTDSNGLIIEIYNSNLLFLQKFKDILDEQLICSKILERKLKPNKDGNIYVVNRFIHYTKLKPQYCLSIRQKPSTYLLSKYIQPYITKIYCKERIDKFINCYEDLRLNKTIPLVEIFHSLQGEGSLSGVPQIFIRVKNCNLKCKDCDSKYSWGRPYDKKDRIKIKDIITKIESFNCKSICITGGEPTLYPYSIGFLIVYLRFKGYYLNIQTNGTRDEQSIFHVINKVCMDIKPESNKELIKNLRPGIDEIKILIGNEKDLNYAKQIHMITNKYNILMIMQVRNDVGNDDRNKLLEKYNWLINKIINDNTYNWNNIKVLPQLHVLVWGNKRGV